MKLNAIWFVALLLALVACDDGTPEASMSVGAQSYTVESGGRGGEEPSPDGGVEDNGGGYGGGAGGDEPCQSNSDCDHVMGEVCLVQSGQCWVPEDDPFYPNQSDVNAAPIVPGEYSGLVLNGTSGDWFSVDLRAGESLTATATVVDHVRFFEFLVLGFSAPSASTYSTDIRSGETGTLQTWSAAGETVNIRIHNDGVMAIYNLAVHVEQANCDHVVGGGPCHCEVRPRVTGDEPAFVLNTTECRYDNERRLTAVTNEGMRATRVYLEDGSYYTEVDGWGLSGVEAAALIGDGDFVLNEYLDGTPDYRQFVSVDAIGSLLCGEYNEDGGCDVQGSFGPRCPPRPSDLCPDEPGETACSDFEDNDQDGWIDLEDSDCRDAADDDESR